MAASLKEETKEEKTSENLVKSKVLFVFDFDHTLIDFNCDTWVMNLLPQLNFEDEMHEKRKQFPDWTDFMNHLTDLLHQSGCGSKKDLTGSLQQLEIIKPMKEALEKIRDHPLADAVIVSDANTFYIEAILEKVELTSAITAIYSNPAYFDQEGRLIRGRYHSEGHSCPICFRSPNMCKGQIIDDIITENSYSRVVYVGDGYNDYCPAMHLSPQDCVIARKGYGLVKRIKRQGPPPPSVDITDFTNNETATLIISLLPSQQ